MSDTGDVLTYAQLEERSTHLARVLHDAGLRAGDDVAVLAENCLEYYVVYWAALRSGLYFTSVNHHLTADEAAYVVRDCGARAVIVSAKQARLAGELAVRTPGVRLRLAFGGRLPRHGDYELQLATASPAPLPDRPRGADLLYSSGTTGRPKGIKAPLPSARIDEYVNPLRPVFAMMFGIDPNGVNLCPAPLHHAAPLRFGGMVHEIGATLVVMPRFGPEEALAAIERYRVTHSQWVPTHFVRMLKLPAARRRAYDLSSHRAAVHAAAPCPVDVKRAMIDWWGPILAEYYAATEAVGVTFIDCDTWLQRPGSVGRSVVGIPHVCAGDGRELPVGSVGIVYFERETFPFVYHNDPERTRATQHPDHPTWGTTGDVGRLDADGFLYLTDRRDFTIITGGVNVYPQDVENALILHPAVADLAVFGTPDEEMGETVLALVQPAGTAIAGPHLERELLEHLRGRIAGYKMPRRIDFVDVLPRTETGKVRKHELRAHHAALRSRHGR